ncbi:hypothetical protein [Desulfomonile tiedjei]|uniref:Uncharacterized protein n=1 Tax=Desulfomonile tiedjei (strain ATCC 49306 / DSM 6799 / DCB-1) TaxID=706587 RepID=I4CB33_DESTA|nr:hypothetical protein [Desulfomonile tiedjei]AFM26774.1 hypothetical protein Desti_4136 [Desulfomonile tiedjei DSM 6799]
MLSSQFKGLSSFVVALFAMGVGTKHCRRAHMDVAASAAVLVLIVTSLVIVIAILIGTLAFQLVQLSNMARLQKNKKE